MLKFIPLWPLLIANIAIAGPYPLIDLDKRKAPDYLPAGTKLESEHFLFVTHPAKYYPGASLAAEKINETVAETLTMGIPVAYITQGASNHLLDYLVRYQVPYVVNGMGGDLEDVTFIAKKFILAGGYFELCLGETVRDILLQNEPKANGVHLIYVADAVTVYFAPNHNERTMGEYLRNTNKELVLWHLKNFFFTSHDGAEELGYQRQEKDGHVLLKDHTFTLYQDFKEIGKFGTGPRKVRIDFMVDTNWQEALSIK